MQAGTHLENKSACGYSYRTLYAKEIAQKHKFAGLKSHLLQSYSDVGFYYYLFSP
jgi:hypothetical protein